MRIIGLDIGSRTVKRVITEDGGIVDWYDEGFPIEQ